MNKKIALGLGLTAIFLMGVFAGAFVAVIAQSASQIFTIGSGIYPGAADFTVWTDGSTYYAKNNLGRMLANGTDADQVINYAVTNGQDSVFLSAGNYTIDTIEITGKSGLHLYGEGWKTILIANSTANMINVTLSDGVLISDLFLDGASISGHGIFTDRCWRMNIRDCRFYMIGDDAVSVTGTAAKYSLQGWIDSCWIEIVGSDGISLNDYSTDWHITNNDIGTCTDKAISLTGGASNCVIADNTIWGSDVGIYVYQTLGATLTGNRVDFNQYEGILIQDARNIVVTGCSVFYNSIAVTGSKSGLKLQNSANCSITGGRFGNDYLGAASETQKHGILEETPSNYNVISGTNCGTNYNGTYGIVLSGANSLASNDTNLGVSYKP